jgi:hypothetical protein
MAQRTRQHRAWVLRLLGGHYSTERTLCPTAPPFTTTTVQRRMLLEYSLLSMTNFANKFCLQPRTLQDLSCEAPRGKSNGGAFESRHVQRACQARPRSRLAPGFFTRSQWAGLCRGRLNAQSTHTSGYRTVSTARIDSYRAFRNSVCRDRPSSPPLGSPAVSILHRQSLRRRRSFRGEIKPHVTCFTILWSIPSSELDRAISSSSPSCDLISAAFPL